jgi:hypothetical protein
VDPALKSALGLTVWAEDPGSSIWYCIRSDYVKGIYVPTELVKYVAEITKQYNIVRRIADPHEVWYIQTASSMGISYMGVYKKNERKGELIKGLQEKLGGQIRISPYCEGLISELQECRWSDRTAGKIVNSSSYHLLDSAQYFCDAIPKKQEQGLGAVSWDQWIYQQNEKRLHNVEAQKKRNEVKVQRRAIRRAR